MQPRGARLLAASGFLAIFVVAALRPLRDFDLPWHLSLGRSVYRHGGIPRVDDLAFTHGTLSYLEVVGDLFLFGVASAFGERGLTLVGAAACAATALLAHARLLSQRTLGLLAAALVALAVLPWLELRPATLSFPLLALVLYAIDRHRRAPEDWKFLAGLVPVCFVWANVHGFVSLAVLLLAGYAAHRLLARAARGRLPALLPPSDGTHAGTVTAIALSCAAAASVNTIGPSLLFGPFRRDERLSTITEWARPTVHFFVSNEPIASAALAAAVALFALGREPDGRRMPPLFDISLVFGSLALALSVVRFLPLALLVLVPVSLRRLAFVVPQSKVVPWAASLLPLLGAGGFALRIPLDAGPRFDPDFLPVAAVRFVKESKVAGRMYNFWPFGGYIGWTLDRPVFLDGRNQLAHERSLLVRADRALFDPTAFAALDGEYRFDFAITGAREGEPRDLPLAEDVRYALVYLDDLAAVYVKRDGPNQALAATGYRVIRHLTPPDWALLTALNEGPARVDLVHDGVLAGRQAPASARAAFFEACAGLAARDQKIFERARSRLRTLRPGHPAVSILAEVAGERGLGP